MKKIKDYEDLIKKNKDYIMFEKQSEKNLDYEHLFFIKNEIIKRCGMIDVDSKKHLSTFMFEYNGIKFEVNNVFISGNYPVSYYCKKNDKWEKFNNYRNIIEESKLQSFMFLCYRKLGEEANNILLHVYVDGKCVKVFPPLASNTHKIKNDGVYYKSVEFDEKKNTTTANNFFFNFLTLEDELIDSTLIDNRDKKYYVQFDDEVKSFGKVNERNDSNGRKGHIQPLIDLELFSNNKEYKLCTFISWSPVLFINDVNENSKIEYKGEILQKSDINHLYVFGIQSFNGNYRFVIYKDGELIENDINVLNFSSGKSDFYEYSKVVQNTNNNAVLIDHTVFMRNNNLTSNLKLKTYRVYYDNMQKILVSEGNLFSNTSNTYHQQAYTLLPSLDEINEYFYIPYSEEKSSIIEIYYGLKYSDEVVLLEDKFNSKNINIRFSFRKNNNHILDMKRLIHYYQHYGYNIYDVPVQSIINYIKLNPKKELAIEQLGQNMFDKLKKALKQIQIDSGLSGISLFDYLKFINPEDWFSRTRDIGIYKEKLRTYVEDLSSELFSEMVQKGYYQNSWKSERSLFNYCKLYFNDAIYQYKDDWLGRQSIDIYIPSINIGIEYQGKQHYTPVEYFGGKEHFEKQVENDEKKLNLCIEHNVQLLYWAHTVPITNINFIQFMKDNEIEVTNLNYDISFDEENKNKLFAEIVSLSKLNLNHQKKVMINSYLSNN